MKQKAITCIIVGSFLGVGTIAWGAKGNQGGKPPEEPDPPDATPIDGYYFWRLGHMDGPHDLSMALGISRDGKVAVGSTKVVDFIKAWRCDIDWAINTPDPTGVQGEAPLYNELQVQESVGGKAAYAASDKTCTCGVCPYDKENLLADPGSEDNLIWCGSLPVGTLTKGTVSYAAEWLWALPVEESEDPEAEDPNYIGIPDFGGGTSDMVATDVSADGTIIVGTGNVKTGPVAFRADMTTASVDENGDPVPPVAVQLTITEATDTEEGQTLQTSSAEAVSADGLIIAGFGGTKTGNKAFVTTFEGTEVDEEGKVTALLTSTILPTIPGGKYAEAYAMTVTPEVVDENGVVVDPGGVIYVAGRSDSPKGPQACIWFEGDDPTTTDIVETWVVKGIGGLSKKKYDSVVTGIVYRPGSTAGDLMVVGISKSILYPAEAFVWTGNPVLEPDGPYTKPDGTENEYIGYMYDLEKILIKTGAGEASGLGSAWILNEATGVALSNVTNDGEAGPSARIVGWGTSPEGGGEAWLVANFPYGDLAFIKE
jgi:uncharacterized membrane protein